MGYTTDFDGEFSVTPTLRPEHVAYLQKFAGTRRMMRDADQTALRPDPIREAVGLPVGPDGAYFVGAEGFAGQEHGAPDVVNGNIAGGGQPGLWCQWVPSDDGTTIAWDLTEKFYNYVEWLQYLIDNFLAPWGYSLNGQVMWQGEESGDMGQILVADNGVRVMYAVVTFEER